MAIEWYVEQGGKTQGPMSGSTLKRLVVAGQIQPDDLVWKDGMPDWKPARSIKGLFPESSSKKSPPPLPKNRDKPKSSHSSVNQRHDHEATTTESFVFNPLVVGLMVIFFVPIGVLLVWFHPTWERSRKMWWTKVSAGIFLVYCVIGLVNEPVTPSAGHAARDTPSSHSEGETTSDDKDVNPDLLEAPKTTDTGAVESGASLEVVARFIQAMQDATDGEADITDHSSEIENDSRLKIVHAMGHLDEQKLYQYLRLKREMSDQWEPFPANLSFLLLLPSTEWPTACRRLGLTREEYSATVRLSLFLTGVPEDGIIEAVEEMTGEPLDSY
ncbi:MAG: DUF4339 domain-containing protein [Planctomycetaceae bacterium]|nr:DUF4339 domain-containing protein [Planctomycetaceae bacterium]